MTAITKVATGWWAAQRAGIGRLGRVRAGTVIVARGEFNIVIAGLAGAAEPRIGPLAAAYVLIMAVGGPVITRFAEPVAARLFKLAGWRSRTAAVAVSPNPGDTEKR